MTLLSRADLETYADVHYEDNTTGEIVEEEVRTGYKNLADSAIIKNEAGDLGVGLEWNADLIRIKAAGVTLAMMENRAQSTFIGRKASAGTGAPQEMSAAEAKTILAIAAGDVSGLSAFATSTDLASATGTLDIARIANGTVTYAKFANGTGLSVIGRSANTGGVNADIVGVDGQVLRVSGTALGFGTIVAAGIASDAVTTAKILDANVTLAKMANLAQSTLIGRAASAGTGVPTALSAAQAVAIIEASFVNPVASTSLTVPFISMPNGAGIIFGAQTSTVAHIRVTGADTLDLPAATKVTFGNTALSAFATSTDISAATGTLAIARIADGAITLAKMANLAQSTIIGRAAAAGTGVPTDLSAAQVSTILGLATIATSGSASDLGTGTIPAARIANATITLAMQANLAQATVIGRASGAGTGVPTALAASDLSTILGLAAIATSGNASDLAGQIGTTQIAANAVAVGKLAQLADQRILGNVSGATANVAPLTASNVATMIGTSFGAITMTSPFTMTGLTLTSSATLGNLSNSTADGSDNAELRLAAAAASRTRGAFIRLFGNEHASTGDLLLTAGEAGNVVPLGQNIDGLFFGSKTFNPPNTLNNFAWQTTVTVTGARVGDLCLATHSQITTAGWVVSACCDSNDSVTVTALNVSGGTLDLASGTLRVMVFGAP